MAIRTRNFRHVILAITALGLLPGTPSVAGRVQLRAAQRDAGRGGSAQLQPGEAPGESPTLPLLLQDLSDPTRIPDVPGATICSTSADALARMGIRGLGSVEALAEAALQECGNGSPAPARALSAIATALSVSTASLSDQELEEALASFEAAEIKLGDAFPQGARAPLAGVQTALEARRMGWFASAVAVLVAVVQELLSAARSISGVLLAVAVLAGLLGAMKYAPRVLRALLHREAADGPRVWEVVDVEEWILRPGAFISRLEASPIPMASILRRRAGKAGITLKVEEEEIQEAWDTFSRSAAGGVVPSSAANRWVEETMEAARSDADFSPPTTLGEVVQQEIRARYSPAKGAPSLNEVEETIRALAWETMQGGRFSGWVPVAKLENRVPSGILAEALPYARSPMGVLKEEQDGTRVQLTLDEEMTARLGSLHLLQDSGADPQEILAQLGALHQAARRSERRTAAVFLKRAAAAMLDAAQLLEGGGGELGIAEEALKALAQPKETPQGSTASVRLNRLLNRLRTEESPSIRERVITAMGELGPQAGPALPALMGAVEKEPPGVALAAMDTLGRIGPSASKAVPLLLEAMEKGRPSVQQVATRALGRMGPAGEAGAETLLAWTSQGGVPHELHVRAAEALGGMPGLADRSIPTLTELLRSPVATEVRAAAALSLARLDTGRREVEEVLRWARNTPDQTLKGMVEIAIVVRKGRLRASTGRRAPMEISQWLLPMAILSGGVAAFQFGAVVGSHVLNPRTLLPALFLAPAIAFLAGMVYAGMTRRLPLNPILGGGVTGWAGSSGGLLAGFLISGAMTPLTLVAGGGLALAGGAFGASLVKAALDAF